VLLCSGVSIIFGPTKEAWKRKRASGRREGQWRDAETTDPKSAADL